MRTYWVYILASRSRRTYTGVTGNLLVRIAQHRAGLVNTSRKYKLTRLVLAESTHDVNAAIAREKQIKGWSRAKKLALISAANPTWDELLPE